MSWLSGGASYLFTYHDMAECTGIDKRNLPRTVHKLIRDGSLTIVFPGVCGHGVPTGLGTRWVWVGPKRELEIQT